MSAARFIHYVLLYTGSIWEKILHSENLNYLLNYELGIIIWDDVINRGNEGDDGNNGPVS